MNYEYLKYMTDKERRSNDYLFYLSLSGEPHIKIGAYNKLEHGLKLFLTKNITENFELYIWKNNPKNTRIYTRNSDIQNDCNHKIAYKTKTDAMEYYNLILTAPSFNGTPRTIWSGRIKRTYRGKQLTKECVLRKIISKHFPTYAYIIIKSVDRGFVFSYRTHHDNYNRVFEKGQVIFED